MAKVVSVFNQKGGVGKTTTNINLSAYISTLNKKVLVIDADPQGNTTSGFGIDKGEVDYTLYHGLAEETAVSKIIRKTNYQNLDIIPSDYNLSGAEVELSTLSHKEKRMKNLIEGVIDDYDYVFIDCPPSLGLISINALTVTHSVLVPIQCEYYALEGVSQLINTINLIKKSINPRLEIEGILITMYDGRTNLSLQVVKEVRNFFGEKVYKNMIPRNVRLAEAPSHGMTIEQYDSKSKGASAYFNLAKEFIEKG